MLLKPLKQFTLSATLRNAVFATNVERLARFYRSPALCQTLTTSKSHRRLSRDDRRAVVEAFVSEYRAANGGKFPTFKATQKQVGGCYYVVRDILQELKLKPNAPLPIVAKPLSEVSASVPNDTPIVSKPLSEVSASIPNDTPIGSKPLSEVYASIPNDTPSRALSDTVTDPQSHSSATVANDAELLSEVSASVANDACLGALNDADTDSQSHNSACNAKHFSDVVVDPVPQASSFDKIETGSDSTLELSHSNSDESNLQGNNLVITATDDKEGTEIASNDEVDSKQDSEIHLPENQNGIVLEECLKNSENLTHVGSQEPKADHLEVAAVSANVVPTEAAETTRQVSERGLVEVKPGEKSSAWTSIMSFAKEFANYWRKG